MRSILLSIKPKWCLAMARGTKTIDVHKDRPAIDTPFRCYIYCTKEKTFGELLLTRDKRVEGRNKGFRDEGDIPLSGKVIGEFVCNLISPIAYTMDGFADVIDCKQSCLLPKDFIEYGKGKPLYGWRVSDLKIYDEPKELSDFFTICPQWEREQFDTKCFKCEYFSRNDADMCCECGIEGEKIITRPPQGWCYVEGCG